MRKCKCSRDCEAVVKSHWLSYARGHSPASHIVFTEERKQRISAGRKRYFANGGVNHFKGKKHTKATKRKMSHYALNRTEEHKRNHKVAVQNRDPMWYLASLAALRKGNKIRSELYRGVPRTLQTRKRIARTRKRRFKQGLLRVWNKGQKGVCVSWAKGLTKHTDPRVKKISEALTGHPLFTSRFKFWYPSKDDKQIQMRSSWEVAFALWLDRNGIEWEFEPKFFYVGGGPWNGLTYTPDFYLPNQNLYVDPKGYFRPDNLRKLNRFQEWYPDVKLMLFDEDHLCRAGIIPIKKPEAKWEKIYHHYSGRTAKVLQFPKRAA